MSTSRRSAERRFLAPGAVLAALLLAGATLGPAAAQQVVPAPPAAAPATAAPVGGAVTVFQGAARHELVVPGLEHIELRGGGVTGVTRFRVTVGTYDKQREADGRLLELPTHRRQAHRRLRERRLHDQRVGL